MVAHFFALAEHRKLKGGRVSVNLKLVLFWSQKLLIHPLSFQKYSTVTCSGFFWLTLVVVVDLPVQIQNAG